MGVTDHSIRAGVGVLALAAAVAGCGGEEPEAGRTATVGAGDPATVVAREYSFDPSSLVVEDGDGLQIELDNQGSLAHNLRVFGPDGELGGTPTFQGGETKSATLDLAPGTYRMICTVGNHEELGMSGEIEVK